MLATRNNTPFSADTLYAIDKDGRDHAVVIVKGTFTGIAKGNPGLAPEQEPLWLEPEHYDDPVSSSLKHAPDICLKKPGTDVVLVGNAYPPKGPAPTLDLGLAVGPVKKKLRVFGPRMWSMVGGKWTATAPVPFTAMPLTYEKAYGGKDESDPDPKKHEIYGPNPVGTGFCAAGNPKRLQGLELPNVEDPDRLITGWKDRPFPAGFGFIAGHWASRQKLAGTYDATWKEQRMPLLPIDFDDRFFNAAHPELITPKPLVGGEPVRAVGVLRSGDNLAFALPKHKITVETRIEGTWRTDVAVLDTVVVEPDLDRVLVTWRATVACPRKFLYIRGVSIHAD